MMSGETAVQYPSKGASAMKVLEGADLSGKYFIITGSNAGIGFETARALALHNGHVTLACRNVAAANAAKEKIQSEKTEAQVTVMKLDLGSLDSVESFVKEYLETEQPLHCLILNAGIWGGPERITNDGFEITFQVNHLAQFYLTQLLQEHLLKSAPSRVVVLSSDCHEWRQAKLTTDQITWETFSPMKEAMNHELTAYCLSKMCNVAHAKELNRRTADKGLTAYSVHPGYIKTTIGRWSWYMRILMWFGGSTEKGAATSVFCATAPGLEKEGAGLYYIDCRPENQRANPTTQDQESLDRIWELSEEMLKQHREKRKAASEATA